MPNLNDSNLEPEYAMVLNLAVISKVKNMSEYAFK